MRSLLPCLCLVNQDFWHWGRRPNIVKQSALSCACKESTWHARTTRAIWPSAAAIASRRTATAAPSTPAMARFWSSAENIPALGVPIWASVCVSQMQIVHQATNKFCNDMMHCCNNSWDDKLSFLGYLCTGRRASPTVCHPAFLSLIFWQNEKKHTPIVWHPPSPSFPTSQKSIPSVHTCARPRRAHPEFPGPSSKKKERQGFRWEKRKREKIWWKGLNAYRNKFRVPDIKHETGL
jgi:hypothetical protein